MDVWTVWTGLCLDRWVRSGQCPALLMAYLRSGQQAHIICLLILGENGETEKEREKERQRERETERQREGKVTNW